MERNIQGASLATAAGEVSLAGRSASYLDVTASASAPTTGSAKPQLTPVVLKGNGEVNAVASPLADAATTPLPTSLPAGRPGIVLSGHGDEVCVTVCIRQSIYKKNTIVRYIAANTHPPLPAPP